jgi:hypothetical protein
MNTEEQAKAKWCPFARVKPWQEGEQPAPSHNREGGGPYDSQGMETPVINGSSRCIASECMAWRVERWRLERGDAESDGAGNWLPVGYCGLAGQP